jgi:hypothetical protein
MRGIHSVEHPYIGSMFHEIPIIDYSYDDYFLIYHAWGHCTEYEFV